MASLQIKNKYEVALAKLIRETKKDGGIPDFIEVSAKEAWEILNEIRAVSKTGFVIEAMPHYDPRFLLNSSNEKLELEVAEDLVTRWFKGDFSVYFTKEIEKTNKMMDKIPIRIKRKKVTPQPEVLDKPEEKVDNTEV